MPIPRSFARFNRVVTNRITRPLADRLPWFALIVHRGRKSGDVYRTPVNAWLDDEDVIVALTYGPGTDWLKNLEAAGGGEVIARRRRYRVGPPQLIGAEGSRRMPTLVRPILRAIDVDEFALLPLLTPGRTI
ncbi:MAG TPA: nitroreductase family deazaflavin-dependent oxidoreductase [Acidimicrobiia bacterium]|nr:nitroreductase family deazaflavin-dependent oxidoreductase [Acidimicrobiia bacterium]